MAAEYPILNAKLELLENLAKINSLGKIAPPHVRLKARSAIREINIEVGRLRAADSIPQELLDLITTNIKLILNHHQNSQILLNDLLEKVR